MKRIFVALAALSVVLSAAFLTFAGDEGEAGGEEKAKANELKNRSEKVSYAFGIHMGNILKRLSIEVEPAIFLRGLEDCLKGGKTLLTPEETGKIVADEQARGARLAEERNRKEGEEFLGNNKEKEGVETTPSGLQYKVLRDGDGPKPKATDKVRVHYRGTLIDGTEFDSSYKRGQPAVFPLNRVIPGWTEGIQLMKVGALYRFFIPSNLAYGARGYGNVIPPNSVLIFEVDLLGIEGK